MGVGNITTLCRYLVVLLAFVAPLAMAESDLLRGLENYLLLMKGEKNVESLSPAEARDVLEIHERLKGFGNPGAIGDGCNPAVESQIDGEFEGWEGSTIFKLLNGQIWQQMSYSYTYHYAFMPDVLIYPSGGSCHLKVEGVSDTIVVQRLR